MTRLHTYMRNLTLELIFFWSTSFPISNSQVIDPSLRPLGQSALVLCLKILPSSCPQPALSRLSHSSLA